MVDGLEKFADYFKDFEGQYAIIGGTACDLLMSEANSDFRRTKDIDLVLIVETLSIEFGRKFWEFVRDAGYKHINRSTGDVQFYRFCTPKSTAYHYMIELFSRRLDFLPKDNDIVIEPLPLEDGLSSLSAIILDDVYYDFLRGGLVDSELGLSVLDAVHLIPFKAKAFLDLSARRESGEHIDSKNIRKHKNDIIRLYDILNPHLRVSLPLEIENDMRQFLKALTKEEIDCKQLGMSGVTKEDIIDELNLIYQLNS